MPRADYDIYITSPDGSEVLAAIGAADPMTGTPGHTDIDLQVRHLEVGSGSFTTTATAEVLAAVNAPDRRAVAVKHTDDGPLIRLGGPIEELPTGYRADRDGAGGPGTVTVRFADDTAMLADQLVYPDPANASTAQTSARYEITAQNPEDTMRALVNVQCGPGAIAARQLAGLILGTDHGLKPGVTVTTTFDRATHVTEALREIGRLAGGRGLGYRILWTDDRELAFDVYEPGDLSALVWFSRDLGNVTELTYEPVAPTCTVAIVGDATAGTGRVIKERVNSAAHSAGWRRREVFVDARGAANAAEMEAAGDKALADGRPRTKVAVRARETPEQRYGVHFRHDLVSVEVAEGVYTQEMCVGADIKVVGGDEQVTPLIGADALELSDAKARQIRDLQQQLARLHGAL